MIKRDNLLQYCDDLLESKRFRDYCPNGLQVEGRQEIQRIITGVTASQALIDAATEEQADAIFVHHGYFWKGENPCITGIKRKRLKSLLDAGINLFAYHLPLDAHEELGNNIQLAQRLQITPQGCFGGSNGAPDLARYGELEQPMSSVELGELVFQALQRPVQHIAGNAEKISRIGWCTGAAQSYIEAAAEQGLDAFLSGEISEQTVHVAREYGIHYFAAGHHATERYGVMALGQHLAEKFGLEVKNVDIDNPV
jgi:dinuclear metal center YbgI/SA1388 family protein